MAYHISISGQRHHGTEEEARAWENELCERARAFVAELEGVQSATFAAGFISSQDLTNPDPQPDSQISEGHRGLRTSDLKGGTT